MRINILSVSCILLTSIACSKQQRNQVNAGYKIGESYVPYALNQPDTTFFLPKILTEISGLSYDESSKSILCVGDEDGKLFFLDKNTGQIIDDLDIGDKNDYDGVEKVGSIIYILESDGDLHRYDMEKRETLAKIENRLEADNDLEGITYHKSTESLLLSCKKEGLKKKDDDIGKIIYQAKMVELDKVSKFTEVDLSSNFKEMSAKGFNKGPFFNFIVMQRLRDFSPSGIAVKPSTGEIYLISSKAGVLVVLEPEHYQVTLILFLNRSTHIQPEGICFDKEENLYISNEGRGKPARLHVFRPSGEVELIEEGKDNAIEVLLDNDSIIDHSEQKDTLSRPL
jgi:uncharacterized protein YjiK